MRLGFIGTGIIGGGMARHALAEGHEVSIGDLNPAIREAFAPASRRVPFRRNRSI